jgi:hypothetical protein
MYVRLFDVHVCTCTHAHVDWLRMQLWGTVRTYAVPGGLHESDFAVVQDEVVWHLRNAFQGKVSMSQSKMDNQRLGDRYDEAKTSRSRANSSSRLKGHGSIRILYPDILRTRSDANI